LQKKSEVKQELGVIVLGYDATIVLKEGTNKSKVEDFLTLLGYTRYDTNTYYHYNEEDFKSLYYVHATFDSEYYKNYKIYLRTLIYCSNYDLYFINRTIREFRKFFECDFRTDIGRGKYFKHDKIITKAEAGCYKSIFNTDNEFTNLRLFVDLLEKGDHPLKNFPEEIVGRENNPIYKIRALALPYMATIIEEYFRNTYIALLMYSERKEKIFSNIKINSNDILRVSNKEISIEEAISRTMSFQNIYKITSYYRELDPQLDIKGILSKPYKRRKESLFMTLDRILNQRHELIHSNKVNFFYQNSNLKKDIDSIEESLKRVYKYLIDTYSWVQNSY